MITWVMFLAVGILIGVGVGLYMSRLDDAAKRTQNSLSLQLVEKEQEMAAYKEQVNAHFVTTASLVNTMTESYRAVHEHLSTGANNLCKDGADVNSIPFEEKKMIAEASAPEVAVSESDAVEAASIDNNVSDLAEPVDQKNLASPPSQVEASMTSTTEGDNREDSSPTSETPAVEAEKSTVAAAIVTTAATAAATLQEQEAVVDVDDDNVKLDASESDQVSEQGNSDAANDEVQEPDSIATDSVVSEIEKSRVNASRMVH